MSKNNRDVRVTLIFWHDVPEDEIPDLERVVAEAGAAISLILSERSQRPIGGGAVFESRDSNVKHAPRAEPKPNPDRSAN